MVTNRKGSKPGKPSKGSHEERVLTMEALAALSDSDDDSSDNELPSIDKWPAEAKALRQAIERGDFEHLIRNQSNHGQKNDNDEESIEEISLGESEDDSVDDKAEAEPGSNAEEGESSEDGSETDSSDGSDSDDRDGHYNYSDTIGEEKDVSGNIDKPNDVQVEGNADDSTSESGSEEDDTATPNSKGLQVVTQELLSRRQQMPWPESFAIVPANPLPFENEESESAVDVHDDLKRELAFYDLALEAAVEASQRCKRYGIPFSRPDDFFAEMVKSDEHMARVKDRLIFETKKIEAVAQRRANKEQKLRAREKHATKLAEKAKQRKEHFNAVESWAKYAVASRGSRTMDNDEEAFQRNMGKAAKSSPNKKRQAADRKFGFGGKRGRFKQTDPKALNDFSSYNPKGNFSGGMKRGASSSKRPGKRAREAKRSRK